MNPPRDAHFLHAQKALEPVVAAPIDAPRALAWVPGKEVLLVAGANGAVTAVEPSFGSRQLWTGAPEPAALTADHERVAVLTATGTVEVWRRDDRSMIQRIESGLVGDAEVRLAGERVLVTGEGSGGRRVRVYRDGSLEIDAVVQPATALGVDESEALHSARSLETGLIVRPFAAPLPEDPATGHSLRFVGHRLLGVAVGGATVWEDTVPTSIRLLDTSAAALTVDGQVVALGTFGGLVAICPITAPPRERAHPPRVSAHEAAVRALAFSSRGRWLATVGENCRLWAW